MSDQSEHQRLGDPTADSLLRFMHVAERLKDELRHSFTSGGRPESVAEHSWRVVLMAVLIKPYLPPGINWERLLEMLVIHDLVEARTGDIPIFDTERKNEKHALERVAMNDFQALLPEVVGQRIRNLWEEFEEQNTLESKIANALDKLEAQIQHNEANLETWLHWEKKRVFGGLDEVSMFHPTLSTLKQAIVREAVQKLEAAGEDIKSLSGGQNS